MGGRRPEKVVTVGGSRSAGWVARPRFADTLPPVPNIVHLSGGRRLGRYVTALLLLLAVTLAGGLTAREAAGERFADARTALHRWWIGPPPTATVLTVPAAARTDPFRVTAGGVPQPGAAGVVFFSPWNWAFAGGQAVTNTPGAYLKFRFTGDRLDARFRVDWLRASAYPASSYPAVSVQIDDEPPRRLQLAPDREQLNLLAGAPPARDPAAPRTARLLFAATHFDRGDRWRTPVAALRLSELALSARGRIAAPPVRPHRLLVYADSHGEGVEVLAAGSWSTHQDAGLAFPQSLAEAWDAEVGVVAFGGSGYVTPVAGAELPAATDTWARCFAEVSRLDRAGRLNPPPDVILSALGDNDPDYPSVSRAARGLAGAWRRAAPDAALLFALPPDRGGNGLRERLLEGLEDVTDPDLWVLDPGRDLLADPALSFGKHLNAAGQRAYADALAAARAAVSASAVQSCPRNRPPYVFRIAGPDAPPADRAAPRGPRGQTFCLARLRTPAVTFRCEGH